MLWTFDENLRMRLNNVMKARAVILFTLRLVLAAVLAASAATLVFLADVFVNAPQWPEEGTAIARAVFVLSLLVALMPGVPIYLAVRAFTKVTMLKALIAGFVSGMLVLLASTVPDLAALAMFGFVGAVGATILYIAMHGLRWSEIPRAEGKFL